MSRQQLAELLTGKITDWSGLGARAGAVKLAWRTDEQAIPELILRHLNLKPGQVRSRNRFFENADAVRSSPRTAMP